MGLVRARGLIGAWLSGESATTGTPPTLILLTQITRGFLGYTSVPLSGWYRPGTPMLQPESALLFTVGLVVLLLKYREPRGALLGLWVVTLGLVVGLSESTPAAQRLVAAAPAAALVIGLGLSQSVEIASRAWPRLERIILILMSAVTLWISMRDLDLYFFQYAPDPSFDGSGSIASQRIADDVRNNPEVDQVIFFGNDAGPAPNPNLLYLAHGVEVLQMVAPWGSTANPRPAGHHLLFAFLNGSEDNLPAVQAEYPGGETEYISDCDRRLVVTMYEVAAQTPKLASSEPGHLTQAPRRAEKAIIEVNRV